MALNDRQQRFVEEYLIDLNATQAAIRAGYSAKAARSTGWYLLQKPEIQERVGAARQERTERTRITADRVLEELARLGFANILDFTAIGDDGMAMLDLSRLTRDQAAAIQEIIVDAYTDGRGAAARPVKRTRVKLADKKAALELIARHLGMFKDRGEPRSEAGEAAPVTVYELPDNGRDPLDTGEPDEDGAVDTAEKGAAEEGAARPETDET